MKNFLLIMLAFSLSGCASWDRLSEREQQAYIIAGSVLATGFIVAHSNDSDTNVINQCYESHPVKSRCPK